MGKELKLPCEVGQVSDGYHTFEELYEHRVHLFIALMKSHPEISWVSCKHDDGSMFAGWVIAGMNLPTGVITYHLPVKILPGLLLCGIQVLPFAPKWDGHTPSDVLNRLSVWNPKN